MFVFFLYITTQIEQYHKEILTDVTDNLTNNEWRVRISCCNALADLLRTANVQLNLAECGPELWKKLFRVMDDIHEGTRLAATNTAKILSKVNRKFFKNNSSLHIIEIFISIFIFNLTHRFAYVIAIFRMAMRAKKLFKRYCPYYLILGLLIPLIQ